MKYVQNIPFSTATPIRRFVCINGSPYKVGVKVTIEADPEKVNFYVPKTEFNFTVKPRSYNTLITLVKQNPRVEWGNMKLIYEYEIIGEVKKKARPAKLNMSKINP
jgi:hypothetical protein